MINTKYDLCNLDCVSRLIGGPAGLFSPVFEPIIISVCLICAQVYSSILEYVFWPLTIIQSCVFHNFGYVMEEGLILNEGSLFSTLSLTLCPS